MDAAARGKFRDVAARFRGILRPEDVASAFQYAPLEFEEITVEVVQRFPLDFVATLPRRLPIREAQSAPAVRCVVLVDALANDFAVGQIAGFFDRTAQKLLGGDAHRALPVPLAAASFSFGLSGVLV